MTPGYPTRVVLIAPGFAPATGGVETHVGALARGLTRRGVDVEAWVPDRAVTAPVAEEQEGLVIRRFPSTGSTRFPFAPRLYGHARARLDRTTTVHVHGFHNIAAAAVLAGRGPVPFVFTPHFHGGGHTRLASIAHVGYRPVGRLLFARARAVVAVSNAEASLIGRRFPFVHPHVIHNGVDVAGIAGATARPEQPTVLVLGRLEAYKRVDRTIAGFSRSRAPGQLVIVGDGPDRERLTRLAMRTSRAGDIRFLGRLPRADVNSWLRTAQCVVSLSEHEAFGLVALEAAAGGAGVVLSDIAAHREMAQLLPPGVVALVGSSSPDAIALALDRSLAAPRPGTGSVRDWSLVADEHLELYRDLALRRSP